MGPSSRGRYNGFMSKPEPILPEKERKILLELYENPDKSYDTSLLNDMLHFADLLDLPDFSKLIAARGTPEYMAAFRETVKTIESLVEKGLIDGKTFRDDHWGMYYKELKVRFKGRQAAIREKKRGDVDLMPDFSKL
jgi:hypothetical protein